MKTVKLMFFTMTFFLLMTGPCLAVTKIKLYYPVQVTGPLVKLIKSITKDFEKENPDVKVNMVWGGNYNQNMQKTMAAMQAGTPPDVAVHLAMETNTLSYLDAVIPLNRFIEKEGDDAFLSDFFPGFVKDLSIGDDVFALPFQRSTPIVYYNKDLFKKAGVLSPPKTWKELVEVGKKLTVREGSKVTQWGVAIPDHPWLLSSFIAQNGGKTHSDDHKKAYLDKPDAIEALQFWIDMVYKHKITPTHISFPKSVQDFIAGKTAMLIHSTGNLSFIKKSATFDWGVAFLPKQKKNSVVIGGAGMFIFKNIPKENQEAAWKFVKFATSRDMQVRWGIGSGYIATRKSSFETPEMVAYVNSFPPAKVARDQLPYATAEMSTFENQKVQKVFITAFQEALDKKYSASEALKSASADIKNILKPFQNK